MIMNVGRVCMKVKGRDAGSYCVITKKIDKKFAMIEGRDLKKEKKVNTLHLEPTPVILNNVKKSKKREDILKDLEEKGF